MLEIKENRFKTTRDITKSECPWLDEDIKKDTVVFGYLGCTYGAVSRNCVAYTLKKNETPFFELPHGCTKKF